MTGEGATHIALSPAPHRRVSGARFAARPRAGAAVRLWLPMRSPLLSGLLLAVLLLATPAAAQRGLRVVPDGDVHFSAVLGGAVEPAAVELTLGNANLGLIEWAARTSEVTWLRLSETSGSLRTHERTTLTLSIDPEAAARLTPGEHVARLGLENVTFAQGNTSLRVVLVVRGARGLAVGRRDADGRYELVNEGDFAIEWEVRSFEPWLLARPQRGRLEPGETTSVATTVPDELPAPLRPRGGLVFANVTDGVGSELRLLELDPDTRTPRPAADAAPEDVRRVRELSRFGITWTFDREVPAGHFANGDPWVLGPVLVVRVDPPSRSRGGRTTNGGMVNPSPRRGMAQGYDSATYGKYAEPGSYVPALNVALDTSPLRPIVLPTHSSLVSSISEREAGARPQLRGAAVLTVLDAVPPLGSFRPPYAGDDKTVRYHVGDLRRDLLANLEQVPTTPPLAEVERMFERPWIDHVPLWFGRYVHPAENMPDYGREITDQVSTGALMLLLDLPLEAKETLLVRYVQLGVDLFGLLQDGCHWPPSAGHLNGRKWPILFAGLMLGDERMQAIGREYGPEVFSEDGHTFFVEAPRPEQGYRERHVGLAEWGTSHATRPELDDPRWFHTESFPPGATQVDLRTQSVKYRLCCTANTFWGQLLAAHVLDAVELWNHPPLFAYQDRFLEENQRRGVGDYRLTWRRFYLDMWLRHRREH